MTSTSRRAPAHAACLLAAAQIIAPKLMAQTKVARADLNRAMGEAFGSSSADGAWSQRDSFLALEIGTIIALRKLELPSENAAALDRLAQFAQQLPTQTVRSEEQVAHQHFSTPIAFAWLAQRFAAIRNDDVILEPSAGTGMLVAWASEGRGLHLNEIDSVRSEVLRLLYPGSRVTSQDAARIGQLGLNPSVVVMNPPFARNAAGQDDPLAAARHIAAAATALRAGGRLVAIMPESFSPHGRGSEVFARSLRGCRVVAHFQIGGTFKAHGTSVAVRLLVVDKQPGRIDATVISRRRLVDLLPFLADLPARSVMGEGKVTAASVTVIPAISAKPSLFNAFAKRTTPMLANTAPSAAADTPSWQHATYAVIPTLAAVEQSASVYTPWRPQRITFAGAADHPAELVESAAMASVLAPEPTYIPRLPTAALQNQVLSAPQLETVVHALDALEKDLPGRYMMPDMGLDPVLDAEGHAYREGFFLGDGTGAGKGRQLCGIVMDQWLRGSRRHIWISENNALIEDARRDWSALGGQPLDIRPLSRLKPEARMPEGDAIWFVPYGTLRSASGEQSRLRQILEWCGADYEGLILFDEAHAMGGVTGGAPRGGEASFKAPKGSQQGIAGVELQNRLPRARVVYASATGATDINNLAYATRLGLWGEGTSFTDRHAFIACIRSGGIAAMELVARELKAMGVYTARSISLAGVEYNILEHTMTPDQIVDFDTYADAWSVIHRNMEAALGASGVIDPLEDRTLNPQALAAARSRFESTKQRFFGQLLLSMKLPSLLPAMQADLDVDRSVVVQLVSTSEALLGRRLASLDAEDRAELAIDLSPKELCLSYLEHAFPTRAMATFRDEEGNEFSKAVFDEDGNPVHCPEALRLKAESIELLGALPPIAPALDAIITHFGVDNVAEVTGRTRRLLTLPDGSQKLQSRTPLQGVADANAFMAGTKRVLVFSDAGGTGRSYHASLDVRNQQTRVHYLLEPGWRADKAIQGLGRTHRTHQASAPMFRPVTTDCRGERRFISTIARRLDALGALTRGQRQTGGQGLFDPADNLESDYAREALLTWYRLLHAGMLTSTSFGHFCERTGMRLEHEGSLVERLPPIQRWLNRILALPIAMQNAIFDEFLGLVSARIDEAIRAGIFDAGVETVIADQLAIIEERDLLRINGSVSTKLLTIKAQWAVKVTTLEEILRRTERAGGRARPMRNGKSGRVALFVPDRSWLDDKGRGIAVWRVIRPDQSSRMTQENLDESQWNDVGLDVFEVLWLADSEHAATNPLVERFYLATGRLLPIWNHLGEDAQVRRVVTHDGRSILGRIVPTESVNDLLDKLGITGGITLTSNELVQAALAGKVVPIDVARGLSLKRARVNGERRLEILGFDPRGLAGLKAKGCFTEIIQFKTRLFVPVNSAELVLQGIAA